jgi:hypothetical protein
MYNMMILNEIKTCTVCDGEYPQSKHNFDGCFSLDPSWDLEQVNLIDMTINRKKCDIFTPHEQVMKMQSYLIKGNILDPCVGTGNLIANISCEVDAIDIEYKYLKKLPKNINRYYNNFLTCAFTKTYKNIIMNPPYIRIQDLDLDTRKTISTKFPILSGNFDIYYAFILNALSLLDSDGVCVSINPSSILYNKSSKKMMEYLIEKKYIKEIIDYGSDKIFKDADTYVCIMVFTKQHKDCVIYNNTRIPYDNITDSIFIQSGNKINDSIKTYNGIATLCDNVYMHKTKIFDEPCIRELYKVSTNTILYVIYPYTDTGVIIPESVFKEENPRSYDWLLSHKDKLANRDHGKKKYEAWYAYGRKQGLVTNTENVLYISTMCNIDYKVHRRKRMIHCSGICIHGEKLDDIYDCITRQDNKKLLQQISSKRSGGWFNVSSTNIKQLNL